MYRRSFILISILIVIVCSLPQTDATVNDSSIHNKKKPSLRKLEEGLERHEGDASERDGENPPSLPRFTTTPSSTPSAEPSNSPTLTPTEIPSTSPTTSPSSSPSAEPSDQPSTVPSLAPSSHPSLSPSSIPSPIPACVTDDSGNFGITSTSSAASDLTSSTIVYAYDIETSGGFTGQDAIGLVEDALGNVMLADLFEACPSSGSSRRLNEENDGLIGDLVGFSSSPEDLIDEAGCENEAAAGNECTRIQGRFTLYTQSSADEGSTYLIKNEAIAQLKNSMAEGNNALYVHENIEKITYVDPNAVRKSNTNEIQSVEDTITETKGINQMWVIAPALFGVLAVAFLVVMRRRSLQKSYESNDDKERSFYGKYDLTTIAGTEGNTTMEASQDGETMFEIDGTSTQKPEDVQIGIAIGDQGNTESLFVL